MGIDKKTEMELETFNKLCDRVSDICEQYEYLARDLNNFYKTAGPSIPIVSIIPVAFRDAVKWYEGRGTHDYPDELLAGYVIYGKPINEQTRGELMETIFHLVRFIFAHTDAPICPDTITINKI